MENKKKTGRSALFSGPFAIIAVWYGTHVGPGFAGGAQMISYFVKNGWLGVVLGPIVLMILAVWVSYWYNEFSRKTYSYNYKKFYETFFGEKLKTVMVPIKDIAIVITCIVTIGLVYATGGSLLNNLLGLPIAVGGIFTCAATGLLVMFGQEAVRKSSTIITILLVAIIIIICIISLPVVWKGAMKYVGNRTMNSTTWQAWQSILLYFPLYVSYLDAGMATSEGVIRTKKDSLIVAVGGSALLGISIIMMNIIFAAGMPDIQNESLPSLWSLTNVVGVSSITIVVYTLFAWCALVSTGVGNMTGWIVRMEEPMDKINVFKNLSLTGRRGIIVFLTILISIALGQFGVMNLVTYGYGLAGSILLFAFIIPCAFLIPWRIRQLTMKNIE